MKQTTKTAGELSLKADSDKTKYDPLEIGYALSENVLEELYICAQRHEKIFDEDEFFLILIVGSDPLIRNVQRHKYAAFLHMPKPRPNMSVFLYKKSNQSLKRLWVLPSAISMAYLSESLYVDPKWQNLKKWSDAFFKTFIYDPYTDTFVNKNTNYFFELIRKDNNIKHLSEQEFLDLHGKKVVKPACDKSNSLLADSLEAAKVIMT